MTTPAGARGFVQARLIFRKGTRTAVYVPRDRIHEKAMRGAMARHGWRVVVVSAEPDRARPPEAERLGQLRTRVGREGRP